MHGIWYETAAERQNTVIENRCETKTYRASFTLPCCRGIMESSRGKISSFVPYSIGKHLTSSSKERYEELRWQAAVSHKACQEYHSLPARSELARPSLALQHYHIHTSLPNTQQDYNAWCQLTLPLRTQSME